MLDLFDKYNIIDNGKKVGGYLTQKLDELGEDYPMILERRGIGLMQGLVFDKPVNPILTKALEHGLVLINAGTNVIRFVPPLIITEKHVDTMLSILKDCIE